VTRERRGIDDRDRTAGGGRPPGDPSLPSGLLERVFDESPALVYVKDRENRFTYANQSLCRLFGRERRDLLGRTTHDVLPAAVADEHRANDERVLADGAALQIEETNAESDGLHTYLSVKYPLRAADGRPIAVCGISTDITESRRREEAALLGEATLHSLMNAITETVFLMTPDGTVLAVNETGAERLGAGREELLSRSIYDFIPPDVGHERAVRVRRVVQSGEPVRFEDERGGRTILNSVYPIRSDGQVTQLAVFGYDISDLRGAERRLKSSEERYRLLAENASDVVFAASDEGVFTWVSPSVTALLGWQPDELVGSPFVDLLHPDDQPRLLTVRRGLEDGGTGRYEARVRTAAGAWRWVAITVRDITGETGDVTRVGGWRDIQAEVEARESLTESRQMYRTLTEASPDFTFIVDRDLHVQYVNPTMAEACGRLPGECIGAPLAELFGAQAAPLVEAGLEEVLATGDRRRSEERWDAPSGTAWLTTWLVPIVNESGEVDQVFGVGRDVTDLKRTQDQLAEVNAGLERRVEERTARLEAANEELQSFAYAVSHDLRAPLRAIDGFSAILMEDQLAVLDDAGLASLSRVRAAAQRMGQLMDALLTLSRLSRKDLRVGRVDLSRLAAAAVEALREQEPERRVVVSIADGCVAVGDVDLVDVVLTNLLGNAWKFTSGREEAHIEFGEDVADGERAFFVRDDGAGFDPAYVDKLFQPFQRLHREEEYPGTGIGLATVRRIVSRLGGRCWAEGAVDAGATIFFTLGAGPDEAAGS